MGTVTAFEAKTRFGDLLERVSRGEEIVITRHDKPVARIVPEGKRRNSEVQAAWDELLAIREELRKRPGFRKLTMREIREAIEFGRK
jgi:prevent-host-death family protein